MQELPARVFLHAASCLHFDLNDSAATCLNPDPPSEETRPILYPTVAAFYDSLVASTFEPPRPFIHKLFMLRNQEGAMPFGDWLGNLGLIEVGLSSWSRRQ